MNEQQLNGHRRTLRAMAQRLQSDMSGLRDSALHGSGGEASGGISNAPLHLADLATDNFEQEFSLGLLQNQQNVLNAIVSALNRIDDDTYGLCERCGNAISGERLTAIPYAARCIACEVKAQRDGDVEKVDPEGNTNSTRP